MKNKYLYPAIALLIFSTILGLFFWQDRADQTEGGVYKIGFITDIHAFRNKKNNYDIVPRSRIPFLHFIDRMNKDFRPDFVVQGGDLIEGRFREGQKSIDDFTLMDEYYARLKMPRYHVIGNHETSGFSKDQWMQLTGNQSTYYYFDYGDIRSIILDGNDTLENKPENIDPKAKYYFFSERQLEWLEESLKSANEAGLGKIVFIHYFLLQGHEDGISSKGGEKIIFPDHAQKVREILSRYGVSLVLSGHVEKLFFKEVDGVRYFSSPGIFKSEENDVLWLDSFSEITLNTSTEEIAIDFYYKKEGSGDYKKISIPSEEFYAIEK